MSSEQKIKFIFRQTMEDIVELTPTEITELMTNRNEDDLDKDQTKQLVKTISQLMSRQNQTIVLRQANQYKNTEYYNATDDNLWLDDVADFLSDKINKTTPSKPKKNPKPSEKTYTCQAQLNCDGKPKPRSDVYLDKQNNCVCKSCWGKRPPPTDCS